MKKVITKKCIIFQALIGIILLVLSYKYIDTAWIKWPFMIMLGGAFYYSTKEDLAELFKQSLEEDLEDQDK